MTSRRTTREPGLWIAFLRAINVGGHTVRMSDLRALFEELAFDDVATFIASGNVIFRAPGTRTALERAIEKHLRANLGYEVATFLRTPAEVAAIARRGARPPIARDDANVHVAFLKKSPAAAATTRLVALRTAVDEFHVHGREAYWRIHGGMGDSAFTPALLEKTLGLAVTLRNLNTVRRLAERYA